MRRSILILAVPLFFIQFICIQTIEAQVFEGEYFVYFTDKIGSRGDLKDPNSILSAAAQERRELQGIALDSSDLPVSQVYLHRLIFMGASIKFSSKWMNGAYLYNIDSSLFQEITGLNFIRDVVKIGILKKESISSFNKFQETKSFKSAEESIKSDAYYNRSAQILTGLRGDYLHSLGYKGKGVLISVNDAGFSRGSTAVVYKELQESKRLIIEQDVVEMDGSSTDHHSHGTTVLMFMAANVAGEYVGTAPEANYALFRTEYGPTETLSEEYNWIYAAERADSLGAMVINSSLGYSRPFSDSTMSHKPADMDGNTTPITIGADIAASKGMIVVNSAGNSGTAGLNAPADGDSVFSIGATSVDGSIAGFSSRGPTADGRTKPDIVAWGAAVSLWSPSGFGNGNGTSYSSPIIAGLMACLRQAFPAVPAYEIVQAVKESADRYKQPDNIYGHGTPDFKLAFEILSKKSFPVLPERFSVQNNPFSLFRDAGNNPCISYKIEKDIDDLEIQLLDLRGRLVSTSSFNLNRGIGYVSISEVLNYQQGAYMLRLTWQDGDQTLKLINYKSGL